jgi:FKBP-type peptidyl-prolyl cis-trans isomerase FkpA
MSFRFVALRLITAAMLATTSGAVMAQSTNPADAPAAAPAAASPAPGSAAAPPAPGPVVQSGPRIDPQRVFLDRNRRQPGWQVTGTGLQFRVVRRAAADALQPDTDDKVRVNYEGRLIDGKVFDSSYSRGRPMEVELFKLIKGWQEGIPMMRVGEEWEFVVPQQLGYGPIGNGSIPGGATLIFRVELLGFEAAKAPKQEPKYVNPETEKRIAQEKAKEKKK